MSRIWLVRHAASTVPPGIAIGAGDPPLSAVGVDQARRLATELAGLQLRRVWSSDRERAFATARIVAGPHGLAVEPSSALREIDFGAWEGRSLGDLWSEEPDAALAWEKDLRATPPSFGESLWEVERRVRKFWESVQPLPVRGDVTVVAHRGSLAVLKALITGEAVSQAFAGSLELASAVALPCL